MAIWILFFVPGYVFGQETLQAGSDEQVIVTGMGSWILFFLAVVLSLLSLVVYAFFGLKKQKDKRRLLTNQLSQFMQVSNLSIWQYDIQEQSYVWIDRNGFPQHYYDEESFSRRFDEAQLLVIKEAIRLVSSREQHMVTIEISTYAENNPKGGIRDFLLTISPMRYDHDRPTRLVAICYDHTDERRIEQESRERLMRYQSIFNNVLVDMVVYDADGLVVSMNERMQRTLNVPLNEILDHRLGIREVTGMSDFDFEHFDSFWATRIVTPEVRIDRGMRTTEANRIYYELQLIPVRNKDGKLLCIYGTGFDITDVVTNYQKMHRDSQRLQFSYKDLSDYVRNINFVMDVGGVRMVNYSPDTHSLKIFRGLDDVQYELTQTRCLSLTDDRSKKVVMRLLTNMDNRTADVIEERVKTTLRIGGRPLYILFRFVPVYNQQHQILGYYGMCRDISDLKHTEHLLQQQTLKAQEIEQLKNSFLHNMSYEIRTPLNVVVGFAELFDQEHSAEDEELFIREIKDNSAFLLQLINSILFLSRLDARMIEIKPQFIDFTVSFDAHCQQGWHSLQVADVRYIVENHYTQMDIEIDEGHVGFIIEQLVKNAAQNTTKGYVRARYDYMGGHLMIVIEDTGCGIPEQQLSVVYERFLTNGKGSGLGLPICKELISQMGGTIEISSTVGEGTRVWVSLPCKHKTIQRNQPASENSKAL